MLYFIVPFLFIAIMALITALWVHRSRARIASEEKSYNEVEDAGMFQFRTGDTRWSSSAPANVTTIGNLGDAKVTYTNLTKSRKASLEERRKFRIFEQHKDPEIKSTDDEVYADYHEWIERPKRTTVLRDSLCRENQGADRTWVLWVCNNPLCPAYAYVAEEKIEETIQGWLDKAAPRPGQQVLPTYSPVSVGYSQVAAGSSVSWTQPLTWTYMTDGES